ncbi:MAG: porin [Bacteroidetes bacterium]|nr:porin [Bacteroidota bacterium]
MKTNFAKLLFIVAYILVLAGLSEAQNLRYDSIAEISSDYDIQIRNEKPSRDSSISGEISSKEPFAFGDFTWLNGNDRRHSLLLDTKYFTGSFMLDMNYTLSNHHPVDNTVVGSTALARNNEFQVSFASIGGDFHYNNVRGRIMLQLGTRATVVPRNDFSTARGQFDLSNAYRYLSEAYAGYHFNALNGINLDAGIFMSYVGLFSYYNCENWAYQPSFTSDNTPWFFNGMRLQIFPSDKLKLEFWLINGWQSYAKFNNLPGVGMQFLYRPKENISLLSNNYIGTDTPDKTGRTRFHTDNSFQLRYLNRPDRFLDRAAFSITGDLGFENGDGVSPFGTGGTPEQNFISGMIYNRMWFANDKIGWTFGGGFIHNPGRYLVLLPTGAAGQLFDGSPGTKFDGWDISTTLDWMPDENIIWRLEFVHREASIPYFAGHGGVTSPNGYNGTPVPEGWMPDQVKSESRIIFALLCRF